MTTTATIAAVAPVTVEHPGGITETYHPRGGGHVFHAPEVKGTRDGVKITVHPFSYYVGHAYRRAGDPYNPVRFEHTVSSWSGVEEMRASALHQLARYIENGI
ncbi:hypothetical protein [Planomonospora sp. ID82291]|uniref:hypothetical protein n=1 Tax=Planomonospora sp. ID82291 TaxID=2738136 RepID=UPI0018C372E6|nr:hypothetical protein [Planomonospora sp. ID82291]MBG0818307.1 hypothetical protein [Planomonospora sp. ID82291]